jgi:hypothetical protein
LLEVYAATTIAVRVIHRISLRSGIWIFNSFCNTSAR